jgi:hypothetical protein
MRRVVPLILGPVLLLSMAPAAHAADTFVRHVIRTSQWATPSPDPTGLDFMRNGQLVVTDSEVDETRLNKGRNVWRITRGGHVKRAMSTYRFTHEPTDVAIDSAHRIWYFATDAGARIFVVRLGPDGRFGTRDDIRRSFSTSDFGSHDPEGLALGGGSLWLSDGSNERIYRIRPGRNGRFGGSDTDDIITSRSLRNLDVNNLEGVEYAPNGHVFVLPGTANADILEINFASGALVRRYDLSAARLRRPSAIAYGPSSVNPARRSFYIADRGVDNGANPNENDGRIVEVGISKRH